jgi:serine/threonine-protein kinase RsbT
MAEIRVEIKVESDIVAVRQAGRKMARELGFGSADQTRLATAISELARNVIQYAGKGVCIITDESDQKMVKIRVVVEDNGPGIPNIKRAMEDGFSTAKGLGSGLLGTKRLVNEFDMESKPGHTKVSFAMLQRRQ